MKQGLLALIALTMMAPGVNAAQTDARVSSAGETEITSLCNEDYDVALARSGANVVAAWTGPATCQRNTVPTPGDSSAAAAWSADGGSTWTEAAPLQFSPLATVYGRVDVAALPDGSFVYVAVGQEPTLGQNPNPYGRSVVGAFRSTDGGRTWAGPVDVSRITAPGIDSSASSPVVAVDAAASSPHRGTVYLAWQQYVDGGFVDSTFLARSTDGGRTFTTPRLLAGEVDGLQFAFGPGGQVYAVWNDGQAIYLTTSLDGGETFSPASLVTLARRIGHLQECGPLLGYGYVLDGDLRVGQDPSLAVDTYAGTEAAPNPHLGRLHLAVAVDGAGADEADVVFLTSDDQGETWSAPRRIHDDQTSTDQFLPRVTVDDRGVVAAVWHDRRLSVGPAGVGMDVFGTISTDGGATFAPDQRLSDVTTAPGRGLGWRHRIDPCHFPHQRNALVSGEGGFLAAWADNRSGTPELPDLNIYAQSFG